MFLAVFAVKGFKKNQVKLFCWGAPSRDPDQTGVHAQCTCSAQKKVSVLRILAIDDPLLNQTCT